MGLFKKNKKVGLFSDIIRCDEESYLIWKWHPDGTASGEHKREYAIRWGSSLRVKEGEVAVFVYKQKDGKMQDYIEGPFDKKLETANLPVISGIIGAFVGGDTPFQAEVFFINLANLIQTRFAVPYFDVCDPRYPDFAVPVAVRGTISFKIENYREFIKLHRLENFDLESFKAQVKDSVSRYVRDTVANAPAKHNIPVVQIDSKSAMINATVEFDISARLRESFGVSVSGVDIGCIDIDKSSEGYRQLMAITKDITTATIQGQTAANIEHYAESLRIKREEEQYATHKKTQSENITAYQVEAQTEVGIAGAEALGKMGGSGAGDVNLGGGGFNPASMMASMALGGAIGQNMASLMSNTIPTANVSQNPPPIPKTFYHVAKDGKPFGTFELSRLKEMAAAGELTDKTLVWKQGMVDWEKAGDIEELKGLFPPEIK